VKAQLWTLVGGLVKNQYQLNDHREYLIRLKRYIAFASNGCMNFIQLLALKIVTNWLSRAAFSKNIHGSTLSIRYV
jgi:hypothetical protein